METNVTKVAIWKGASLAYNFLNIISKYIS
jgi:hypothetical protein